MKKNFLEYLNEMIYMLETYENGWWVDRMEKAYTKYRDEDSIEKFLDAFGGMGSFNDTYFENECTEYIKTITVNMGYDIGKNGYADVFEEIKKVLKIEERWIKRCIEVNEAQSSYQKDINEVAFYKYLLENYVPGNLHEITLKYLEPTEGVKLK